MGKVKIFSKSSSTTVCTDPLNTFMEKRNLLMQRYRAELL